MAAPDFELYDVAAQMQWVSRRIADIRDALEILPLARLLWRPGRRKKGERMAFEAFRRSWTCALRRTGTGIPYAPGMPLLALRAENATIPRKSLWEWSKKGLKNFGDLFEGTGLRSFDSLVEEFEIHTGGFMVYGAIRGTIQKLWGGTD